jgi:hypothetical protein
MTLVIANRKNVCSCRSASVSTVQERSNRSEGLEGAVDVPAIIEESSLRRGWKSERFPPRNVWGDRMYISRLSNMTFGDEKVSEPSE